MAPPYGGRGSLIDTAVLAVARSLARAPATSKAAKLAFTSAPALEAEVRAVDVPGCQRVTSSRRAAQTWRARSLLRATAASSLPKSVRQASRARARLSLARARRTPLPPRSRTAGLRTGCCCSRSMMMGASPSASASCAGACLRLWSPRAAAAVNCARRSGLARVSKRGVRRAGPADRPLVAALSAAQVRAVWGACCVCVFHAARCAWQAAARSAHLGMWRYGDVQVGSARTASTRMRAGVHEAACLRAGFGRRGGAPAHGPLTWAGVELRWERRAK